MNTTILIRFLQSIPLLLALAPAAGGTCCVQRLSDMGPDGDVRYGAYSAAVAYNSQDDEYLVVWEGDDDTAPSVEGEFEIYGQRLDAATGAEIGGDFRLSDMGPDGDFHYGAYAPAVAYNSQDHEYLVVWHGDDQDEEYEIYGQRVDAATGAEIGGDIRLSDMGPDGNPGYDALFPTVAYDSAANEYLVVWSGDDDSASTEIPRPWARGLADQEYEVYGQWLAAATGAEIGGDTRLSDMGPDGDARYGAYYPVVTYDSAADNYLAVWSGDDDTAPLVDGEFEIYGQWLDATTRTEIGGDTRLSDMGPDGDARYGAFSPAAARRANSAGDEIMVVWRGDDDTGLLADGEFEVYGQRLDASTRSEIGGDTRLSDMGPDGDPAYSAYFPAVTYNLAADEYLVVWEGDDNAGATEIPRPWARGLADDEYEIYGQWLAAASGAEIGGDVRLSDMGPEGDDRYDAYEPAVAANSAGPLSEYLVVWHGDDNTPPLVDQELEIFGRLAGGGPIYRVYLPQSLKTLDNDQGPSTPGR